ncbi:MAG TPA: SIMPL domain-containing protein [Gaiellales bacterium]
MAEPRQLIVTAAVAVLAIAGYQALHDTSRAPAAPAARTPGGVLQPFMRFTGSGNVTMHPDRGTISFSTHGSGATLADAQNAASRTMNLLIAKLRSDGVARSDMRTDGVTGDAQPLNGDFSADQSLTVTVRNLSRAGRLLADGAATGAQSDYGVDFSIGNQHHAYDSALRSAIADARSKADAAAAAAGLHVSGVVSVDESRQQPFYDRELTFAPAKAVAMPSVPIRRGTQKVTADVTVVFSYSA